MLGEEKLGEEILREFQTDIYTLLYLKWINYKDSLPAKAGDTDSILGPGRSYMPKGN